MTAFGLPALGLLLAFAAPVMTASATQVSPSRGVPLVFLRTDSHAAAGAQFLGRAPGLNAYFRAGEILLDTGEATVQLRFRGSDPSLAPEGRDMLPASVNVIAGEGPGTAISMTAFRTLIYRGLYPGIDLIFSGAPQQLKSEFVVAPGVDPSAIRLTYRGIRSLHLESDGSLVLTTEGGPLREDAPEVYQDGPRGRVAISGRFRLFDDGEVGFEIGEYDRSLPLIIDPVLSGSTVFGGTAAERTAAVAVDKAGHIYVAGSTESLDLPRSAGTLPRGGGTDAYVAKFDATGRDLIYLTYLGGRSDDRAFGVAVDTAGCAYITGWTHSPGFPVAAATQWQMSGGRDAFIAKLNASGNALLYSTFLGGSGYESGNSIAVDGTGAAYVAGETTSPDFPVRNARQASLRGGHDAFVARLNPDGTVAFATFLGGSWDDRANAIALDSAGNVLLTGTTNSRDFPVANAAQPNNAGGQDVFITKLDGTGSTILFSTYIGGLGGTPTAPEEGSAIAADAAGAVYVAGNAASLNFPVANAFQASSRGGLTDAFVLKLSSGGVLEYSTFLSGSSVDYATAIAVDGAGTACVVGYTASTDFPLKNPVQAVHAGYYDAFLLQVSPSGRQLFGTYLGGNDTDAAAGVALAGGQAYIVGQTLSSNFPTVNGAPPVPAGSLNAFLTTVGLQHPPRVQSFSPISGSGVQQTFTAIFSDEEGVADLRTAEVIFNFNLHPVRACYLHFDLASRQIWILSDDATHWLGPAKLGSAAALQNAQCSLDLAASTATESGNSLSLTLALRFTREFGGQRYAFLCAVDKNNSSSGFVFGGAWAVPSGNSPPTATSFSPSSGRGATQSFTAVFADPDGAGDLRWVELLFNSGLSAPRACYAQFDAATNSLWLLADDATGWLPAVKPGSAATVQNSQCRVNAAASTVTKEGNTLTLILNVTFTSVFSGSHLAFVHAVDNGLISTGYHLAGTWTVPAGGPPQPVSITPSSGAGTSQVFSALFTDPDGSADLRWVEMLFNSALKPDAGCYLHYEIASRRLWLLTDDVSGWLGPVTIGSAQTIGNNQCTVGAAGTVASQSGDSLTLSFPLSFSPSFAGPRTAFLYAEDSAGLRSTFKAAGTWTVP